METRNEIRAALERARVATHALLDPVPDDALVVEIGHGRPPLVWDVASIAYFEELWLLDNLVGEPLASGDYREIRAALRRGASERAGFPVLRPEVARGYAADVRAHVLESLVHLDLDAPNALLRHGFVFGLVVQHELQRQETMLETLQLRTDFVYALPESATPDRAPSGPAEISVPAGSFTLGAMYEPFAYDNELAPHEVELAPFRIDRAPVSNEHFARFVKDKGYRSRKLWSPTGWDWRERESVTAPLFWEKGTDGWERVRFGRREPVPANEPVQHVSWYEAEAFARWAGKRLPTELEWERAAGWNEQEGKFRYPWGQAWMGFEASLDRRRFSPAPVGSYAGGVSPLGCVQMGGDVWEWTSSHFKPYPGFLAFPYPGLSEIYFGDEYRVRRGGSWATDALVARTSFRGWDDPGSRYGFSGFRCARDG